MDYRAELCNDTTWQATIPTLVGKLGEKWEMAHNGSISSCQVTPKKLTTEAYFIIYTILGTALLCIIGSSINAYESFRESSLKKKSSRKVKEQKRNENGETQSAREIKSVESSSTSVWRRRCKNILDCFCIQENAKRLLIDESKENHLPFLDGMRALFFLVVYAVHFLLFHMESIKTVRYHTRALLNMPLLQTAGNTGFGIDGFFVLSGFLTAFLFCKVYEKNGGKMPWFLFYANRLLRVTPVYMVCLGIYATLLPHASSGPLWPVYETNPICKNVWIWNLFYLSNFNSMFNQCMIMTWYLSVIIQLYIISPLYMVSLIKSPKIGYTLCGITILLSSIFNFVITVQYGMFGFIPYKSTTLDDILFRFWQYVDVLHQNTLARVAPYLIGLILGVYLNKRKLAKKNSWLTLTIGWIFSLITIHFSFFTLMHKEESVWEAATFNSVKYLIFAIGFSWIVFVCATGQGGFVEKFFSLRIFQPISRLSFSGYLTQTIILEGYFLIVEDHVDESFLTNQLMESSWVMHFIWTFVGTIVLSIFVSLLFEYPVGRLVDYYIASFVKKPVTDGDKKAQ